MAFVLCPLLVIPMFACNGNEEITSGSIDDPETTDPDTNTEETTTAETSGTETSGVETSEPDTADPDTLETETDETVTTEEVTTADETTLQSTEETETTETETTEIETDPNIDLDGYTNAEAVQNAGASWEEGAFASSENAIEEAAAVIKTAEEMLDLLSDKASMARGEVYKVTEPLVLTADTSCYGNMAALIADGGIIIKDVDNVVIKELIIVGDITVENTSGVTLFNIDLRGGDIALNIDASSSRVKIESSIISAKGTAVMSACEGLSIYETLLTAEKAVISSGAALTVQNSKINAVSSGIVSSGESAIVRNNNVTAAEGGIGVDFKEGSYNGLIALNTINDVKRAVYAEKCYNCSVILNSGIYIGGINNTNLYVIKNNVSGFIELKDNKYLICDDNSLVNNKNVVSLRNDQYNGNNLHDVNARLEHGADEELLPHTNKDLFIGMTRERYVRDLSVSGKLDLSRYIESVEKDGVVIVPPGVYSVNDGFTLTASDENASVYAYGAYIEAVGYPKLVTIDQAKNISIYGLTVGYTGISAGQIQVLKSIGFNKFLVVSSAGFGKDFGATNPSRFVSGGSGAYFYHAGEFTSWTELGAWGGYKLVENEDGTVFNEDGTFTIEITGSESIRYSQMIKPGEILGCRLKESNDRTMYVTNSKNVLFKDMVLYGYSSAMTLISGGLTSGVKLYRHHNTAHSAYEIDKETYEKYQALEEKYNVDLDIYIDEEGRYRGSAPRVGSMDASHSIATTEGISATSTLFENACDDASNQRGDSSLLHDVIDNKDGTTTLIIKNNIPETYYGIYRSQHATSSGGICTRDFKRGDYVFIYASNGKIFCDTRVIADQSVYQTGYVMLDEDYTHGGNTYHWKWTCTLLAIKVKTSEINMSALDGIAYQKNGIAVENKVFVDNMSRNSQGFTFDNCMVRHNRGRVLPKTRNVTIKNCSFVDTSYAGIVLSSEVTWGESSVPSNVKILNCLFDGTCTTYDMQSNTKFAAIAVEGLGATDASSSVTVSKETLPAMNITITGNLFRNVRNNYFITVAAAQNITIKDNVFETGPVDSEGVKVNTRAIFLNGCMNVNISGNTFPESVTDVSKVIIGWNYKELHGDDVDGVLPSEKGKYPGT